MELYEFLYSKVIETFKNLKINQDEKFSQGFLLTCLLIYNLSDSGEDLENILNMINQFDYDKNFNK